MQREEDFRMARLLDGAQAYLAYRKREVDMDAIRARRAAKHTDKHG